MDPTALRGVAAMLGCCTIWGLSPLFYKVLDHVPADEVLVHRTFWSLVFFMLLLAAQRRMRAVISVLRGWRAAGRILLAALMISANWFTFIFAVQSGYTVESSMGYYTFPLVAVVVGWGVFGEALGALRTIAVGLAALAVITLSVGLGAAPWIALILATTFAAYGVLKKTIAAGPVVSVAAEVLVLAPLALGWFVWAVPGWGAFGESGLEAALLIASGVQTGLPLVLFSYASHRLQMATVGVLQYLNPTLQFLCATLVFGELFTLWHMIAFALIWTAVSLYSVAGIKAARNASRAAGTSLAT